jgi:hypothetical protein
MIARCSRAGLLFAALAGAGAASAVSAALRFIPFLAGIVVQWPPLALYGPLVAGAAVALLHLAWARNLAQRVKPDAKENKDDPSSFFIPPQPSSDGKPQRWMPEIRD